MILGRQMPEILDDLDDAFQRLCGDRLDEGRFKLANAESRIYFEKHASVSEW